MTEIYYFTGTGFSLKTAKLLKEKINDDVELIPIVSLLEKEKIECKSKTVGFVFPMHSYDMPKIYKDFIQKIKCPNAEYLFALVTCGGAPVNVFKSIDKHLEIEKKRLDAYNFIVTPNTFDPVFKVNVGNIVIEERRKYDINITEFAEIINTRRKTRKLAYRNYLLEYTIFPVIRFLNHITKYYKLENAFYSDETCTSCGKCALLCPSEKIKIINNKPHWDENVDCGFCLGCFHRCPTKSIQIKNTKSALVDRIYPKDIELEELIIHRQNE